MALALDMTLSWRTRIYYECQEQSTATRESVISWLLGKDLERFEMLNHTQMEIAQQRIEYRYRVLRHRYLGLPSKQAYRNLTTRLGSLVLSCNKIHRWITKSCENQRAAVDVLQKVIQLLQTERYMQQQIVWITHCSSNYELRNALLFTSTEEYCLHPVGNQPLLVYRFVSYLRSLHWGTLTPVPTKELIQLVFEDSLAQNSENLINLLDNQITAQYQDTQALEEQQVLRIVVKQKFISYLAEHVGPVAVQWLQLYLQGQSTEMIARSLNLQVKEVYQLRQEIIHHAVRVLALKSQPELVGN